VKSALLRQLSLLAALALVPAIGQAIYFAIKFRGSRRFPRRKK